MNDLSNLLRGNPYPGRGILLGHYTPQGSANNFSVIAYFIMGRSENSRNRIFSPTEDGIRTLAFDESKMSDPSLIIYHPVRVVGKRHIVTNGDQTDTIRDFLRDGKSFSEALRTRQYEPDAPNYTPRISGLLECNGSYHLSILKHFDGLCNRQFFEYEPRANVGHFLSTYVTDGDPLPSFRGEPVSVSITAPTAQALAEELWEALDMENKVSLFVRYVNQRNGFASSVIVNKHGGTVVSAPKTPVWREERN